MPAEALATTEQWRWGIVLDAGSSGTRLYVYRWLENSHARDIANAQQLQTLPIIVTKKKWTKKTKPGISTFGQKPTRVGPDHLEELFELAEGVVPKKDARTTPLFLLATAGMRLLPKNQQRNVLQEVCAYAGSKTNFLLPDCDIHIQVISGEVEGLYGWIAVNYLLGGFDAPKKHSGENDHPTFGFLDMGGASAQIAFAPNATEAVHHANDLKLMRLRTLDGTPTEYKVFTTTWLGFGVNEARRRYLETLETSSETGKTKELLDPCLPKGLQATPKGDVYLPDSKTIGGEMPILTGTGKFDQCLNKTLPLLEKDHICKDEPCLLGGVHVPAIDFDVNHFVGVSEYWHTTHEIFQIGEKEKAYDFGTYQRRVSKFCGQDWSDIEQGIRKHEWGKKVDERTAVEVCFKASWLINILHEGIGIPRVGLEATPITKYNGTSKMIGSAKEKDLTPSFKPINKIDDTEVSWTLGKIVLYASSQIPASKSKALPVGFGSNVPGIPKDFQYPSGQALHWQSSSNATLISPQPLPDELHQSSSILRTANTRRIPGILLFLLILCFAIYCLVGRSRRKRLLPGFTTRKDNNTGRIGRAVFGLKLLSIFRASPNLGVYHRVDLEDGGIAPPESFELGAVGDESPDLSSGSHTGKTSGWLTPRDRSSNSLSPNAVGFENLGSGQGLGIGLGAKVMDRSGLIGRTESRERILGMAEGRRSRKGSPQRGSALRLGSLVED